MLQRKNYLQKEFEIIRQKKNLRLRFLDENKMGMKNLFGHCKFRQTYHALILVIRFCRRTVRHNEIYCDTSVSPRAKKSPCFLPKTNNLSDNICHFGWLTEKIDAKYQKKNSDFSFKND